MPLRKATTFKVKDAAKCPACVKYVPLRANGKLWAHKGTDGKKSCIGSGMSPKNESETFFKGVRKDKAIEGFILACESQVRGSDGSTDSAHYGGADNPHETIKCLKAWDLEHDALLWTAGKYLSRAGKKGSETKENDLKKAIFYIQRRIDEDAAAARSTS